MKRVRSKTLITFAVVAGLLLFLAIGWVLFANRGVKVTVHNSGSRPMVGVGVELGCRSIELGDIAAGGSATGIVHPDCEASGAIEYQDEAGVRQRVELDVYVEHGYRGTIDAEIEDGTLVRKDERIGIGL